jgi:hypothetical protein
MGQIGRSQNAEENPKGWCRLRNCSLRVEEEIEHIKQIWRLPKVDEVPGRSKNVESRDGGDGTSSHQSSECINVVNNRVSENHFKKWRFYVCKNERDPCGWLYRHRKWGARMDGYCVIVRRNLWLQHGSRYNDVNASKLVRLALRRRSP